jgi:hypothetical protein
LPDLPIEFTDLNEEDAMKSAVANGRLVAVLRFGDRVPDGDELAREAVLCEARHGARTRRATGSSYPICGRALPCDWPAARVLDARRRMRP